MECPAGSAGQNSSENYRNQTNLVEQSQGLHLRISLSQFMVHCCHMGQGRKALEIYLEGPFQVLKSCLRLALGGWEDMDVERTSC